MEVKVSKDRIKISNEIIHKGEYRINVLNFTFTSEYENLSKMAIFTKDETSYNVAIIENQCHIPNEILKDKATIIFGVYAYEILNDEVVKRYSPAPIQLIINPGSYEENAITPIDEVEQSTFEEFVEQVTSSINQINSNKQDKLIAGDNITIDENNVISSTGGGGGGTTNYNLLSNKPSINGITLSGNKTNSDLGIDIPTKTSDLTNDSGFITTYTETDPTVPSYVKNITQANITSWNNKSDFSGDYDDLTNKPTIPTTTSQLTNDSNFISSTVVTAFWHGTQTEYDAISVKSPTTLYLIDEE